MECIVMKCYITVQEEFVLFGGEVYWDEMLHNRSRQVHKAICVWLSEETT